MCAPMRGISGARDLDAFSAPRVEVQARGPRLRVARDGEVDEMQPPVRFAVRPSALRVYAPAAAEASG